MWNVILKYSAYVAYLFVLQWQSCSEIAYEMMKWTQWTQNKVNKTTCALKFLEFDFVNYYRWSLYPAKSINWYTGHLMTRWQEEAKTLELEHDVK